MNPALIIQYPGNASNRKGYLNPSRPHDANHIIIGDIGDEEVLVVACDDGDIISYTVQSIYSAIDIGAKIVYGPDAYQHGRLKRWGHENSTLPNLTYPNTDPNWTKECRLLAPWFHENVGESAWGLATHKNAMLLAVSSNTMEITIFAPPLCPEGSGSLHWTCYPPPTYEAYTSWGREPLPITLQDRELGRTITLRGHTTNIPNVAFCDNNLDLEGRYLVSTDINSCVIVWDIWRRIQVFVVPINPGSSKSAKTLTPCTFSFQRSTFTRLGCCLLGHSNLKTQVRYSAPYCE